MLGCRSFFISPQIQGTLPCALVSHLCSLASGKLDFPSSRLRCLPFGISYSLSPHRRRPMLGYTTLRSLQNCSDGVKPNAALIQGSDGAFYGTTPAGANNAGDIFKITPSGSFTVLYSFCSQGGNCSDGSQPLTALVEGSDGDFYWYYPLWRSKQQLCL